MHLNKANNKTTITLFLMTQKGFDVLQALIQHTLSSCISEVVIGRDNQIDNDYSEEIISLCKENQIRFYERKDIPTITSTYSVAISWRWLIPSKLNTLIIFHDSLLPKYRGFAPLVNMLINGEPQLGVTAIFATEAYDEGEIIAQSSSLISYPIKISEAISIISQNYIDLALSIFKQIDKGIPLKSSPQDESLASYSLWRDEDDYLIDWNKNASYILGFINAVSTPYKGASTYLNGKKIRILDVELYPDVHIENRDTGKVIFVKDKHPVIVCAKGLLKLNTVIDDVTRENLIPFTNFRVRLQS